jgi:hypothetical protein
MELETAIKHALDGNALLFLGSGFSAGATPVEGDDFLTGTQLAMRLSKDCELDPPSNELNFASQRYRKKFSDEQLVELLRNLFTASSVTPEHIDITKVPWQSIYTTNYDDVLEKAFSQRKVRANPITCDQDSKEHTNKKNVVVHINGYIDSLTTGSINSSFKLTNTSYLTESFANSNWALLFRRALQTCKACIFIGYSMYDLDIQRIIFSAEQSKGKTIFIEREGKTVAQIENSLQIDFGEVYPIGLRAFVEQIERERKGYIPKQTDDAFFEFDEIGAPHKIDEMRDDHLFDLMLRGEAKTSLIWDRISGQATEPYFIVRKEHTDALSALERDADNVVVHSDMANGKTMLLMGIVQKLVLDGYRVFWLKDDSLGIDGEIERICNLDSRVAIVIENYNNRLDEVRIIQAKRRKRLKLLLSAKRTAHEIFEQDLGKILVAQQTVVFDLDRLGFAELSDVDTMLSTYKLWGDRDTWSSYKKQAYLTNDCDSHFSSILLDIIKSPTVQAKYKALFDSFKEDGPIADVVVAASVLSILGFQRPSTSLISELLRSNYLYSLEFTRHPITQSLLKLGSGHIVARSSMLARYGLTTFMDARALVDRLISIAETAHAYGSDALYFNIYKSLVTFSTLQRMLPEKGKRDALIRFYEALKNLPAAQNHPHFWLQYAIARLASDRNDDLDKARLFLETAYAHAKKRRNYHTRHMDNVKARYLIKHSITIDETNAALLELADGHKLLLAQARTEKTYAPFNVATNYLGFYNAKRDKLGKDGLFLIKRYSQEILNYVPDLPEKVRSERTVIQCVKDLSSVIADIDRVSSFKS